MSKDYTNQNLQGKSYKDKELVAANFHGADIRGADFTNAVLTGSNFGNAKIGQQVYLIIGLMLLLGLSIFLAGFIIAWCGGVMGSLMVKDDQPLATFLIALIFLFIFWFIVIRKGFGIELSIVSVAGVVAVIVAVAMFNKDTVIGILVYFVAIFGAIPGVILGTIALSASRILVGKRVIFLFLIIVFLGFALGARQGVEEVANEYAKNYLIQALAITSFVSVVLIGVSIYISNRVLAEDKNYLFIRKIVTLLVSYRGTNFQGANLTDANFEQANVKSADFRGAKLNNTNWFESKFLEYSRFEETNLEDSRVRKLVATKNAPGEDFDRLDLRGLNLKNAKLNNASLIGADLNETNLMNADLTSAKLVNTQLHKTDLTGATLTGAFIQDWGISTATKFKDVKCEFLFMRLPTEDNPEVWRKPDKRDETFQEGDFAKFITPIIETLDYYARQDSGPHKIAGKFKTLDIFHNKGVDPNAFAVAIQQFAEENPEAELEVISVEGKEEDKLRLQAKISSEVDGEEFKGKYLRKYEEIKSKPEAEIRNLIYENEAFRNHISSLEKLVETALKQKNVSISNLQGSLIMSEKNVQQELNIKDSTIQGDINQVVADSIRDSLNKLENAEFNGGLQEKLKELNGQVVVLCKQLPEDKQKQVAQYLQVLTDEATSKEPRKEWYELSAEGLINAAKSVGETSPQIAPTVKAIVAFLS